MLDFPNSPTTNQIFIGPNGVSWTWDGTKWEPGQGAAYLALSGGTMTGPIASGTVAADPTTPMGIADKQYVDTMRWGDNRIINGDCWIDQRNAGAAGQGIATYTADRWFYYSGVAGKLQWQRYSTTGNAPFPYALFLSSLSAYAAAAGDQFAVYQVIEADFVSDFLWGTAAAKPATLSFWVYSSLTGTFSGCIRNYPGGAPTRSYPFTFSVPAVGWTKIAVTIPGDTTGTWAMSGNSAGIIVGFDLGSGSNYRAAANVWGTGNMCGATGTVSIVGTNGATFLFTGVKFELGTVATPFNQLPLAQRIANCQRYFQINQFREPGFLFTVNSELVFNHRAVVPFRAAPTASLASTSISFECWPYAAAFTMTGCSVSSNDSHMSTSGGDYTITGTTSGMTQPVCSPASMSSQNVFFSAEL